MNDNAHKAALRMAKALDELMDVSSAGDDCGEDGKHWKAYDRAYDEARRSLKHFRKVFPCSPSS